MTSYATTRAIAVDAGVPRITVAGLDVTQFRADKPGDQPMRVPNYTNMEPFAYGSSGALVIPRTNVNFNPETGVGDQAGEGDLWWLHENAVVRYQRVYGGETIVTDYVGFIDSIGIDDDGKRFSCTVAGQLAGKASLFDKPRVKIRKVHDLGSLATFAMDTFGLHLSPRFPNTGLTAANQGGMTWLSWLQTICALSRTHDVQQRSIMPTVWGGDTWSFAPKDVTTKHFTVLSDGQRIKLGLVYDMSEQPNTIFGYGVTPDGERWDCSVYPGFFQGTPAPYPFEDDRDFGEDTEDGDTDTGDGITVMVKKLAWAGFLADVYGDLTVMAAPVVSAVNRLKDRAGLAIDGLMTPAAWLALWDADVVGYSPEGARIMPLAQAPHVASYLYSSTGAIIGRNPEHVAGSTVVSRTIDFGVCEKADAIDYARGLIAESGTRQWAGTITLSNVAVFAGEIDDTDVESLTTTDVMSAKDIRPGMNAWLPRFDGGTLVHVSQVTVDDTTVTLTVSTRGLDVFDITQALQRNQDSKRNVYREWSEANRGVRPSHKFISRDEYFGKLYVDVPLTGGRWNVVPVVMGQTGTVSRSDIRLTDTATEFCYAVFDKQVTGAGLDGLVGDPFDTDVDGLTPWEHESLDRFFENRDLRFVKGQGAQPCGYGWKKGYVLDPETGDPVRTANPLTGTDLDDSSWSYGTDPKTAPAAFLAIYPLNDCVLKRGRLFYALEDDPT